MDSRASFLLVWVAIGTICLPTLLAQGLFPFLIAEIFEADAVTVTLLGPPDKQLIRAGHNVTLPCNATDGTYVLRLEWACGDCKVPGKSISSKDVKLVEYTPESTTLFHHEGRMALQPNTYDLTFRPVRSQDSGEYNCVVNNQRSTVISLLVQDVPDPPGRPLIMGFTSRTVNLSWTPSQSTHHSHITHYIVHIRVGEDGRWDVDNGRGTHTNATHFTVEELEPFTVYSFRVVAVNAIGQSDPSKESYYMVTLRELPAGKPIFTAAHNASATSIQLFWKAPALETIHGEFIGYIITLRPRNEGTTAAVDEVLRTIEVDDPDIRTFVLENLKPYTQYLVSLQVYNPAGPGPTSTVAVMTDEGIPGPPENLTVVRVSDTSVDLNWSRPRNPNGEVRGYRIYYMRGNFTSVRTDHGDLPITYFALDNLEPNSNFKIWTKAFTARHEGESSAPVQIETDASSPGPPLIANLTCQSDSTLYLHWLRPALFYGAVHLYYIYYRAEEAYQFEEIVVNSINNKMEHNFLISNLSVNTMYEVKVRGGTYSRFYSDNNLTYKGSFSEPRKILLFPDCHRAPVFESRGPILEMSAGIVSGIICAGFALFLLVIAMIIYRSYFQGSYYYLDDPPKVAPVLMHDWENDSGGDGIYGSIDVHDFAKHVQELHADGDIAFSKEYESIQAASAQDQHSAEHSHHPENKQKNRYLNIVAYDHSRVPLRPLPGQKKAIEYVNANYIDGYDKPRAYIGTQGPLPSTFDTFWRMVWEQRVYIIVMITNLVERGRKKCDQYWPKEGNENYGFIQVRLIHEEVLSTYTIRKLAIKHLKVKCKKSGGGERIIYQYHYTNWPDHGTPDHPLPVLSFVRKSAAANPDDGGPIIVHCSAGVGRTGTYIVLDAMLQQIRLKGRLNIWGFLKHIRTQRNFLVQTEEQYIFIHDALLEAIQSGDTCVPTTGITRYIKMLQASNGQPEKPQPWFLLQHQHKLVTNFQPRDFNVVSAVKPVNRDKNRSLDHLPMENGRVHLTPKPGVDGSDYINGTWLMGHNRLREFVLTQHPLTHTLLDFWQMIWDHNAQTVVVLTNVDEEKGFPQLWPCKDDDFDTEHWKVRFLEERLHSGLVTVEVAVQSTQDDYELPVRLIHAPDWPNALPALTTTLSLVTLVQEVTTNYQNGPVVVVDKYGGTEGAMFCCLSTLKNQVEFERHLDPYMYFKLYHNRRPVLWHTQDDLLFVYRAMESYLANETSSSGSSSDLAGFSDPIISMPPITVFAPLPIAPVSMLHQLVQETAKQSELSILDSQNIQSPNQTLNPTSPSLSSSTPTAPIGDLSPQGLMFPSNGCLNNQAVNSQAQIGSQILSAGPANGYATLTGNGTIRVPPEGMEDAPIASDVPPV